MNYYEFSAAVRSIMEKRPHLFKLERDLPLSSEQLREAEEALGLSLPCDCRRFLSEFGAGYFGFAVVYSPEEASDFFMLRGGRGVPAGYIPISDNGCGDLYLFRANDGICSDELYFLDHERGKISPAKYGSILDFLLRVGLDLNI